MALNKEEKALRHLNERDAQSRKASVELTPAYRAPKGLNPETIRNLSREKDEPEWMLRFRLDALDKFMEKPMPDWGPDLSAINFDDISYYVKPLEEEQTGNWEDIPEEIRATYDRLGVPRQEAEALAGVANQWDSEVVFHELLKELEDLGVVFLDMDSGLREYEDLVRKHFASVIPAGDNKFAALNSAFWSGGSFIYVPPGVRVEKPLQTYFRINSQSMLQAERTLIIADEGASVSYLEGCFPAGELVSLGYKMKEIEALRPGDTPVNEEGRHTLVDKTFARPYDGEIIEITPLSPENRFTLTPEHPVKAIKRSDVACKQKPGSPHLQETYAQKLERQDPEWIEARDLCPGDFLVFPKIIPPRNKKLEDKFSHELLTILGYYLAKGSLQPVQGKDKAVSFSFHTEEQELYEELMSRSEKLFHTRGSLCVDKQKSKARVLIYSNELYDLCQKHCGSSAKEKALSADIMSLLAPRINYLLRSYLLSDGSLGGLKTILGETIVVRATAVSRILVFQLQELLARQGLYVHIEKRKDSKDKITGRENIRRAQYSLAFTKNSRWSATHDCGDHFLVPIEKIETKSYSGAVFNLECGDPNSYLVKGFAVHNCSAPQFQSQDSLHAAVVELVALPGSEITYYTAQNWDARSVWNLVTKRARADRDATVRWIQGELGSRTNMKYPSVYLTGPGAHAEILSVAWAGEGMNQDTGGKAVHLASNTSSQIISKSISAHGGIASYRGLLEVAPAAENIKSRVVCDALLLDDKSISNTWPTIRVSNPTADIGHEATVSKVGEEQMFYLMSHGLSEAEAQALIVNGFVEQIIKEMPLEYAVEINRLLELQMEGSIG